MRFKLGLLGVTIAAALTLSGCATSLLTAGIGQDESIQSNADVTAQAVTNDVYVYPSVNDPSYDYISSVRVTSDGLVLYLRPKGIEKASSSWSGASDIAAWTVSMYSMVDAKLRPYPDIEFVKESLTKEIYYHAIAYNTWPTLRNRANPINVHFSDYWSGKSGLIWWLN
ncbi:hypothetical protein HY229_01530 [Candidatus Acetothermia bacterium]|nr:hypothetical protein [Candidatus Acetothermia bacterium]MBI3642771.1 hypothetical protein [Candidatus Acetothermia bacterium]